MTQNELEAYDAMTRDRDRWRERAERLERLCPLWIHRGAGHNVGSLVIVCAETKADAESIIREQLNKSGLKHEPLAVTQAAFSKNSVIVCDDGDY